MAVTPLLGRCRRRPCPAQHHVRFSTVGIVRLLFHKGKGASTKIYDLDDWTSPTHLAGSLLRRCRSRRVRVHGLPWGQWGSMATIAPPVWARLGVHTAARMGVAVRDLRVRVVRRLLPVGIGRARRRDGWIYRRSIVRLERGVGMTVSSILLGH